MLHTKDSQLLNELIKWFPDKSNAIKKCFTKYQDDYDSCETQITTQRASAQNFGAQFQQQNDKIYIQKTQNGEQDFGDKKNNLLSMAVPGAQYDMNVGQQANFYSGVQNQSNGNSTQILLLNSVNQIENLPQYQVFLDRLQEEVIQDKAKFMQFLGSYSQKSNSFISCASQLSKIEIQMHMKDQQLEKRLGDQSIDTSKLEIFNSKHKNKEDTFELQEKQDKLYRYKGQAFLQPSKSPDPQANQSHLKDIDGDSYNNFKDSCWVILTGQKPTSGMTNETVGKNENKKDSGQHGSLAGMSNKARLELAMQESRLQHAKETAQVQSNKPGQISSTPPKGEGKLNMRASTLEREPGSTNINHLQLKNLSQIMLPQKRYGHSSTIIDDKLYIFGGAYRKGNGANFHSFHECQLKLESNKDDLFKWRRIQGEAPKLRDSHSCVSFHDHLLIFGGGNNSECFNDLYKFSITNKIWTKLECIADNGCLPSPREGHVALLVEGDKMLVHGGINESQECFNDAYILVGLHQEIDQAQSEIKFDEKGQIQNTEQLKNRSNKFEALRWFKCEQEGDVPSQRDSHSSVLANNQIYIFGGQDNDENLHNDFYKVTIQQTSKNQMIGDRMYYDKVFKLKWKKIKVNSLDIPIKRTSHSMNLFNDRWLVLIGGETSIDPLDTASKLAYPGQIKEQEEKEDSDEIQANSSEEETNNKALNDVWLYDIHMNTWKEIKPIVKVQSCFNSKKMRKSFEPRMAHSAEVWGNYIIIFGGYASQSNQYSPNNFCILSLAGCTDYMLQKPMTIKMVRDQHKKKIMKENHQNLKISIENSSVKNAQQQSTVVFQEPKPWQKITTKLYRNKIIPGITTPGEVIKLPAIQSQRTSQCQTIDLQLEEQEIINRCNVLVEKHNQSKLKFSLIQQLATQIKSPLQLILEIIKSLIDVHEVNYQKVDKFEKQKQIVNINQYGQLDISIHLCQYDEISILFIKDNGPGMTHSDLKIAMTGQCQGEISNKYEIFKYASLHLAVHTFVITKTQTVSNQVSSNLNIKFNNEVHVGLLSSRFVKDSNSDYLIAPIVSFDLVETRNFNADGTETLSHELVAKTPLSEKFINLILSYIGIFQNINELKEHILMDSIQNDKFQTGTQIYLCELNQVLQSCEHDIFLDATKRSEKADFNIHTQSTIQIEQMIHENENLEHSLNTLIKYSYIDFPTHVNLQVNNKEVEKENPFNKIISYVLDNENQAIKGQTNDYRYWIISQQSLVNFGIDDKVINKMEGLLIYKNNEFVKKDDLAQPHTFVPKVGSKRQHLENHTVNDILHGIIMVETASDNCDLTIDKQDLVNQNLLQTIRDEIYANYQDVREQNYGQIPEECLDQQKRMRFDSQQIQTHAMYPQINLCEYGQIAIPMYPNQNDGRITREEYDALTDDKKQEYMNKMNQISTTGAPIQNQNVAVPAVNNYQNYNMQHHQYQNYQQPNPQEANENILVQQEIQKIEKSIPNEPQQRIIPIEHTTQQKADYENEQMMQQQIAGFGPSLQLSYHPTMQSSVPNQK